MTTKCFMANRETVEHKWYLMDAEGQILGRMAVRIASILMGKHKPTYTAHVDTGDFVVVINAEKFAVTGHKMKNKFYFHNTKYPGGLRSIALEDLLVEKPTEAVRQAVKRMLPKTSLGRKMFAKLKVYAGPDHPHEAQDPEPIQL